MNAELLYAMPVTLLFVYVIARELYTRIHLH